MWLLLEDAAKHLGIPFENERQFKRDSKLDISRYFERGASCLTAGWRARDRSRFRVFNVRNAYNTVLDQLVKRHPAIILV